MKKNLVLLFLLVFGVAATGKEMPGYYINLSNDTVKVNFRIMMELFSNEINFSSVQCGVRIYNENRKKVLLKAEQMKEIHFDYKNKHYKFVSLPNTLQSCQCYNSSKFLLQQISDGDLKLYSYHSHSQSMSGSANHHYSQEINVLQKKDGSLFTVEYFFFKKSMSEYLSDCPEIVTKINDKTYGRDDLMKIIADYNQNCRSDK